MMNLNKSLPVGQNYFGSKVPDLVDGCERLEFKMCYNYIQHLSATKCRFITLMNLDPKIDYLPDWIINYTTGNVMDENTQCMQKLSE
jgi:hypothetical protein